MRPAALLPLVLLCAGCQIETQQQADPPSADSAEAATNACATSDEEARQQVASLEADWETAYYRGDRGFFERTLGDDFVFVGPPGGGDKAAFLAGTPAPDTAYAALTGDGAQANQIHVIADGVVVVSGEWHDRTERSPSSIYTEVFVCRNGEWRAVHGHYSELPDSTAR